VIRGPVAWAAAIVLVVEAVGFVFVNGVLATVVHNQQMSLAGLDPDAMSAGTWGLGGVTALYLLVCAVIMLRTALRGRAPGRVGRPVLITCAVVHGVLGALTVGLVGWTAFALMMVVMGLIVLVLVGPSDPRISDPEVGDRNPVLGQQPTQQGQ
jgi:MFS family permease